MGNSKKIIILIIVIILVSNVVNAVEQVELMIMPSIAQKGIMSLAKSGNRELVFNRGWDNYKDIQKVVDIKDPDKIILESGVEIKLSGLTYEGMSEYNIDYAVEYLKSKILNKYVTIEKEINMVDGGTHNYIWYEDELINKTLLYKGILKYTKSGKYDDTFLKAYNECDIGIHHTGNRKDKIEKEIIDPYKPYDNNKLKEDIEKIEGMYPSLVTSEVLGQSVEGKDIYLIKFGKGETKIHFNGSMHSREYFGTTALMKMVEEYSYNYHNYEEYSGYNVNELLDNVTMYIVPMLNPDGVEIALKGLKGTKNPNKVSKYIKINPYWAYKDIEGKQMSRRFTYDWWKSNANGVDLNNNFDMGWERFNRISRPSSEGYKGTEPESEPETKILVDLLEKESFETYVSYHTKGHIIFWDDYKVDTDNRKLNKKIIEKVSKDTGYTLMGRSKKHSGGFGEWARNKFKKPAFTIELTPPGLHSSYNHKYFDREWGRIKNIGLILAEEAYLRNREGE